MGGAVGAPSGAGWVGSVGGDSNLIAPSGAIEAPSETTGIEDKEGTPSGVGGD